METKINLNNPDLPSKTKDQIVAIPKEEGERKKLQILDSIPNECIEKLEPEERKRLFESNNLKLIEQKDPIHPKPKLDLETHPHQNDSQPNNVHRNPKLDSLEDIKEIELMIQLCGNKQELIRILNDFNRILLENSKDYYNIKVKRKEV